MQLLTIWKNGFLHLFFPVNCQRFFFALSMANFCLQFWFTVFPSCGNTLQDFYSIKCIFKRIFLSFQECTTSNSRDILIFEFLWHLIQVIFRSKVAKFHSWLSQHFPFCEWKYLQSRWYWCLPQNLHQILKLFSIFTII